MKSRTKAVLIAVPVLVLASCAGLVALGASIDDPTAAPASTSSSSAATSSAPSAAPSTSASSSAASTTASPTSTQAPAASACDLVPDGTLQLIDAGFSTSTYRLTEPQALTGPDGATWVGGNITDTADGSEQSLADVWVVVDDVVYSLSGGARDETLFPDGRDLLGLSAGDDLGVAVQDCAVAARRPS